MKSSPKRIGLFPGTFDPITIGHQDIINRSLPLFDKLFIGIGRNVNKEPMFTVEQRQRPVDDVLVADGDRVEGSGEEADTLHRQER